MQELKFETGASSAASNNLVLSILKDEKTYKKALTTGFDLLGGEVPVISFRDITSAEAQKQREKFKLKFKAAEISEAASLIKRDIIADCLEHIKKNLDGIIHVKCKRWFDKVNGSSYFSVRTILPQKEDTIKYINIPLAYGYGSHWQYEVINFLARYGFIPELKKYENGNIDYGCMSDYQKNGILFWDDQGYGLKRDMYTGIYL